MATKKNTAIKRGDKEYNYYRITRTVGHEWKNGKKVPVKKQFVGTSKGNAEQKYKKYLEDQAAGKLAEELEIEAIKAKTFGEYAEDYTYNILPHSSYAHGTKRRYEQSYRCHVQGTWITDMPLSEVKARTIQSFYADLDISMQSLKAAHKWMAAFYKWIQLNEYGTNMLTAVSLPDKPDNKQNNDIIVWEPEEIQAILRLSVHHRLHFMMLVMYYAGLRISECCGLQYSDMKDGLLSVNRQYYQGVISGPKHNSYRKIPMHPELVKALEYHRAWHEREMKRRGYKTEYVFTSENGNLLEYGNVRRSLMRFYKRNEIPEKKPHAYRATFCTELCRAGVPLEVASKLMGHKSVEVTAKHYALVKKDVQIEAINKLPGFTS